MASLCFSAASTLRCASFTLLQYKLLIIPPAIELIFATSLIVTNWGRGWRHLLLTAEGWIYFALALVDLLSHLFPAAQDDLTTFRTLDLVLAATSFLPILFYTLFIFLFTRAELLNTLPKRFQRVSKVALMLFIPTIIASNELASFLGISFQLIEGPTRNIIAAGFNDPKDETVWTFFTGLTLALLTAYQAINFCFAFYRLIKAFVSQRQIEDGDVRDRNTLFRGIGWITGGLKLGAIETIIGFAQDAGFGAALTRRILRLLSRAFFIIGVAKGLDSVEDFNLVRSDLQYSARPKMRRASDLRLLISNPRFSTFRQLSPKATDFRAPVSSAEKPTGVRSILPQPQTRTENPFDSSDDREKALAEFSRLRHLERNVKRVTVRTNGGAPTLHMRLSTLDLPSPSVIAESIKSRPNSDWYASPRSRPPSSVYAASVMPAGDVPNVPPLAYYRPSDMESSRNPPSRVTSLYPNFPASTHPYALAGAELAFIPPPSRRASIPAVPITYPVAAVVNQFPALPSRAASTALSRLPSQLSTYPESTYTRTHSQTGHSDDSHSMYSQPSHQVHAVQVIPPPLPNAEDAEEPLNRGGSLTKRKPVPPVSPTMLAPPMMQSELSTPSFGNIRSENGVRLDTETPYSGAETPYGGVESSSSGTETPRTAGWSHRSVLSHDHHRDLGLPPPVMVLSTGSGSRLRSVSGQSTPLSESISTPSTDHAQAQILVGTMKNLAVDASNDGMQYLEAAENEYGYPAALNTGRSREFLQRKTSARARTAAWIVNSSGIDSPALANVDLERGSINLYDDFSDGSDDEETTRGGLSKDATTVPWLEKQPEEQQAQAMSAANRNRTRSRSGSGSSSKSSKAKLARIKSVGRVPKRSTPQPIKSGHTRQSMSIETVMVGMVTSDEVSPLQRLPMSVHRDAFPSFMSSSPHPPLPTRSYTEDSSGVSPVSLLLGSEGSSYGQRRVLRDSDVLGMQEFDSPIQGRNFFTQDNRF
ncbi:hypothetical protein HGRIS_012532 [Hohenbuehelia grisea]|uniref:Uncharacterized protein n=1 Tax=Hohenbuehelia grisea TaxID=104357 RepID=A0ABR3ISJ6_9AGAR